MIRQGLLAYFMHKVDEYVVYFFDPYYYEMTEPFHANFRKLERAPIQKFDVMLMVQLHDKVFNKNFVV